MERQPLTTGQIAKYCGVNFRTVIRWIERGQLKAFKLPGRGDNRVEVRHFLEFLKEHKMPTPQDLATTADRALVVDDDLLVAKLIERSLKGIGFQVQVAEDGFRAGALMGTFLPSLMTLDLDMPGIGGIEVLQFVRSAGPFRHTKVLVVSAMPADQLDRALDAGADDVLPKPFAPEDLVEKAKALAGMS